MTIYLCESNRDLCERVRMICVCVCMWVVRLPDWAKRVSHPCVRSVSHTHARTHMLLLAEIGLSNLEKVAEADFYQEQHVCVRVCVRNGSAT